MGVIGLWKKIPIMLFIAGAVITFWAIMTDNIQIGFSEPEFTQTSIYSVSHPMNVIIGTSNVPFSSTVFGIAETVASTNSILINEKISCIRMDLSKTLSPTGDLTIGVFDRSNRVVKQFGIIPMSEITTIQRSYTVCLPDHDYYVLGLNDFIGAKHTTSDATNFVKVHVDTTDSFDGSNSVKSQFGTAWVDTTSQDLRMRLSSENLNIENTPIENTAQPITFEFTEYPKILFGIIGAIIMLAGAMIWKYEEN